MREWKDDILNLAYQICPLVFFWKITSFIFEAWLLFYFLITPSQITILLRCLHYLLLNCLWLIRVNNNLFDIEMKHAER